MRACRGSTSSSCRGTCFSFFSLLFFFSFSSPFGSLASSRSFFSFASFFARFSAFLSSFFTLVGTHGLHVSLGLVWLIVMLLQVATLGFRPMVARRLFCFALFWHVLDVVWIGVFTIVYLGA